ncbi:MAG TPA: hypothetical protein VMT02_03970 [Burkholderiales bacterium]|jgi:hypothetical protein|nr:hypothetical protein [Burkholderiales bacterium]
MLDRASIVFPMAALAVLTLAVLLLIPVRRFRAGLAWSYVALRLVQSAIHLTYNRVRHRLAAFAASNVVLVMLWTNLLRALSS